jgi:putative peptidoglycan lipid II flippase
MAGFALQFLSSRRFEPSVPFSLTRQKLSLPLAAGGAMLLQSVARQGQVIIDRAFASTLEEGAVAAYGYAQAINTVPNAVLTAAIATALFPLLSRMAAKQQHRQTFKKAGKWSLVLVAAVATPVLALVFFRDQVVSLVFERGAFGDRGVALTSQVLSILPFLVLLSIVSTLMTRLLLAQQRTLMVGILSLCAVVLKLGASFFLVPLYGLSGLAGATLFAALCATTARVVVASLQSRSTAVSR